MSSAKNLGAEISNAVVRAHRRYFGKGPTKAKTYIEGNVCLCVLENAATAVEQTLAAGGHAEEARRARVEAIHTAECTLRAELEQLTQQKVRAFVGGSNPEHDITTLVVLLDGPPSAATDNGSVRSQEPHKSKS
jgi:uncharacterized protein YbcI